MAKHVGMQPLEIGQVARDDVDEIVARPRHEVAGEHVRASREPCLEGAQGVVVLTLQRDLDEDVDAEPDGARIDHRAIAADDARGLQRLDAPRAG